MDVEVFGIGNVSAKNIYKITPGVSAKILKINTDEGKWVKKGDLLVVLDSVDLPVLLEQSKIGVTKAKAELNSLKKELNSLLAQKNLALLTYKRYEKLKEQSFASQAEYDKAKADLRVIESQIASTKAKINSSKAEIQRAKKSVEALEKKLSLYKIYSPIDGYVISKEATISQTTLPTQAILEIVSPKEVCIKAYIDERISGNVKVGDKAYITLRSNANKKYNGYVKRIVAKSDAVTQEREIEVGFENLPIPFYINEQAEVSIVTNKLKDVFIVPANCIVFKKDFEGVWVKQQDKAHFQKIKVLAVNNEKVAIKGVDENTKILVQTPKNKPLKEGMRVH